jgi:hypothetical protein
VTDGQAKPSPLANRLGRKERIEHLVLHRRRNAGTVVADPDFNTVAQARRAVRVRRQPERSTARRFAFCAGRAFIA